MLRTLLSVASAFGLLLGVAAATKDDLGCFPWRSRRPYFHFLRIRLPCDLKIFPINYTYSNRLLVSSRRLLDLRMPLLTAFNAYTPIGSPLSLLNSESML